MAILRYITKKLSQILPSAEVGAMRRQRTFGTTSKGPAIATGLLAGASVTPVGRGVIRAIGGTYVGKRLGAGLLGASVFSGAKSFAQSGHINPIPTSRQLVYGGALSLHPIGGGLGIAVGEVLGLGKKGFNFIKNKAVPFAEEEIIPAIKSYPYGETYDAGKQIINQYYDDASSYAHGIMSSYTPSLPTLNVGGDVNIKGLEGLGGGLDSLKQFAELMGISLVALLAYLGFKKHRKKKKSKKGRHSKK